MSRETLVRQGTEFICELEPGWTWQALEDGRIALAHPQNPPEILEKTDEGWIRRRMVWDDADQAIRKCLEKPKRERRPLSATITCP